MALLKAFCFGSILILCLIVIAIAAAPSRAISTEIRIAAPPAQVWAVLTNFSEYPAWNKAMYLQGNLAPGAIIENIEGPGPSQMVFWPTILAAKPGLELRWLGHFPLAGRFSLPGILDAEHYFLLQSTNNGGTLFIQGERFHGILLWVFDPNQLLPSFQAMNAALKNRAEKGADLPR